MPMKEGCAVFGIYNHPQAATITYLGLQALQHRGQESSGIVSSNGYTLFSEIQMGLVADIFTQENLRDLKGNMAIGHNRYSTTGSSLLKNAQPFVVDYAKGSIALAHNGNLVNARVLRSGLEEQGSIFRSTMDSEVIVHLIAKSKREHFVDKVIEALKAVKGAYSLLLMSKDEMIAVRDPNGFRPLSLARLGEGYVIASETCAYDLIGAEYMRDIEPGELILINKDGISSMKPFDSCKHSYCIFEFIYFSRPDSYIFGESVDHVRKLFGRILAEESTIDADMVMPIPDSGVQAALGFSRRSKIPFEMGLIRSHYVGRTFIEPQQSIRNFGVKIKLNPIKKLLKNRKIIVIDDSIVRGTTSKKIVKMLREAGAKEIHMRISSPPIISPCYFGIDTPTKEELIASNNSVDNICSYLSTDSLSYLSIEGMLSLFRHKKGDFCLGCFTADYPMEITDLKKI